jgi:SprT protein
MPERYQTAVYLEQFRGSISENAMAYFHKLLDDKKLIIKHVPSRKTKLGDFRYFRNGDSPIITVNRRLPPDTLTFILAHETAHFLVYQQSVSRHQPHGVKWKNQFGNMLRDLVEKSCFSTEYSDEILQFSENVRASVFMSSKLHRMLFPDSAEFEYLKELADIPEGSCFRIHGNNTIYIRKEKRRTRIVCLRTDNRKSYLINHKLKVAPVE